MKFVSISLSSIKFVRKMSVFINRRNPVTGRHEWELLREDYDFHQEVARAAYADMLHDTRRNQLYYAGLRCAVAAKHAAGEKAHVLDIGTGTGLLSMMAARCGADSIVACEAFEPMAKCARQIIATNGMADQISVVGKRSTELKVGEDLPHRANILVTEVFDTELIGEGALGTFRHALQNLLEPGALVVPSAATVYIQLVDGEQLGRWRRLQAWQDGTGFPLVNPPPTMTLCPGSSVVHDLQLSAFTHFKPLSRPVPVLNFDWTKPDIPQYRNEVISIVPENSGTCCAVLFWWDLQMSPDLSLTCAPEWHGNPDWRDHWIQAIYYLPQDIAVTKNESLKMHACHNEYSMWFYPPSCPQLELPSCKCGLHHTATFTRIGNLNDESRRAKYLQCLSSKVDAKTRALVTGSCSLLPALVKKLGAKQVFTTDATPWTQDVAHFNKLDITLISTEAIKDLRDIDLVCSEPNYDAAVLPWYNLAFWYARSELSLKTGATVMPCSASLWAIPLELEHLWKIRAPLGAVEGFNMKPFDDLIESSSDVSDCIVEPQPLWEYTNTSLGAPVKLLDFDFTQAAVSTLTNHGIIHITCAGKCHAIGLWMDWHLDKDTTVSTGPDIPAKPGHKVSWDIHTRQGIYLLRPYSRVASGHNIQFAASFTPHNGHIDFSFKLSQ